MSDIKITARTAAVVARSGIGRHLDLTDDDRERIETRKAEQAARLARIAARRAQD